MKIDWMHFFMIERICQIVQISDTLKNSLSVPIPR